MTNESVDTNLSLAEKETLKRFHSRLSRQRVQVELLSVIGNNFGVIGLFFRNPVESAINTALEYLPGHTVPIEFDLTRAIRRMDSIELIAVYARQLPVNVFPDEDTPSKKLIKKIQKHRRQSAKINEKSLRPAGV